MDIHIAFDPLHFIGMALLAFLAGYVGNLLAAIVTAIFTPSLDGRSLYSFAGLLMLAGTMFPFKVLVAGLVTASCMSHWSQIGNATEAAVIITGAIGFLFTLIAGFFNRQG